MPAPDLNLKNLERLLLEGGATRWCVYRTIQEIKDHYCDIELDVLDDGVPAAEAAAIARSAIGDERAIAAAVLANADLLVWSRRWPRVAGTANRFCYWALLPVAPVVYCANHGSGIARWGVSASLAALVTGGILLSLRWALPII
jgi:hypothetical protein